MEYLLDYWYFHIPNYILALLTYALFGRFILGFFVPANWDNYIWRSFCWLTNPVMRVVGWLTPSAVPVVFHFLLGMVWLALTRFVFFLVLYSFGLAPQILLTPQGAS